MKEIPLTQGKIALVDDEDYELVVQFKWYAKRPRGSRYAWYAGRQEGTGLKRPRQRTIRLHRFIMNAEKDTEVDHKNGNGLDNRRTNLRVTNRIGNQRNRGKQNNNSTGYKGVTKHECGKWVAQMRKNGRHLYFGLFDTPEEAAEAYDNAALLHHGEFAKLNFPERQ
jgi:AP2 domain